VENTGERRQHGKHFIRDHNGQPAKKPFYLKREVWRKQTISSSRSKARLPDQCTHTTGDFVGSALIFRGIPAEVDAVTVEPGGAMRWELGPLERIWLRILRRRP